MTGVIIAWRSQVENEVPSMQPPAQFWTTCCCGAVQVKVHVHVCILISLAIMLLRNPEIETFLN